MFFCPTESYMVLPAGPNKAARRIIGITPVITPIKPQPAANRRVVRINEPLLLVKRWSSHVDKAPSPNRQMTMITTAAPQ